MANSSKSKSPTTSNARPFYAAHSKQQLCAALGRMWLIRRFEEMAEESYVRGLTHGTMHRQGR